MRFRMLIINLAMVGVILVSSQPVLANTNQPSGLNSLANDTPQNPLYQPVISNGPGMSATYRSGQTFLTWPEDKTVQGEQYLIYRSTQPITIDQITSKSLAPIATVGKGSAIFYENRRRVVDNNVITWPPRYVDRLITENNGQQFAANWGLLVWTLSKDDFVNSATSGNGYYMVGEIRPNSTNIIPYTVGIGPIAESVADPKPVEITSSQNVSIGAGGHVYIQYMDLRNWNGTFHAPNPTNDYFGADKNDPNLRYNLQYAYDYDVFAPTASMCGGSLPIQIPVFVYLHGHKSNSKGGEGDNPRNYCAYGIYPFDDTDTWWFGFATTDYRQTQTPAKTDMVVNYTEQRILRMIYDLEKNPPSSAQVDTRRIYVAGQSMGGTGALALAERYPNVFAAAYTSDPVTRFDNIQNAAVGTDWQADAAIKLGDKTLNLPVKISATNGWADHLQSYNGISVWNWQDLQAGATRNYHLGNNYAVIGYATSQTDNVVWPSTQAGPMIEALNNSKSTWGGLITGSSSKEGSGHVWKYFNGLPTSASKHQDLNHLIGEYTPFWDLNMLGNETIPGFSNLAANIVGPVPPNIGTSVQNQYYNQTVLWSSSWNNFDQPPVDTTNKWQMSFCSMSLYNYNCGTSASATVDITVRRPQSFVITPNHTYHWENRRISDGSLYKSGTATADENGVLTVPQFVVQGSDTNNPKGNRLVITP